jgi:hypothetical protein
MTKRTRSERGAVAIVATISLLMLFSCAAVAVDLGNAFARKRDLQSQADFAALAGGDGLGEGNSYVAGDPAVVAVADYLNQNMPQNDAGAFTVSPSDLIDDSDHIPDGDTAEANGEVYFLPGDKMRVITPRAMVNFGLASAIGFDHVNVASDATVQIRSGGGVLPFYAVDGCDYGPQTMSDPPPGHTGGLNLLHGTDNGNADPNSINPSQVALNESPSPAMTVTGTSFTGGSEDATKVGFFRNDGTTMVEAPVIAGSVTATEARIAFIPLSVLAVEDVWWVRVYKGSKWSPVDQAVPLKVGGSVLECLGGASEGNFGSLKLPRSDSSDSTGDGWLPINISEGLQPPLTLDNHAEAVGPAYTCADGVNGAIATTSPTTLKPQTNCVDTDTGLPSTAATAGFITGGGNGPRPPFKGRLDSDTTPGCGASSSDRNARWDTGIRPGGPSTPTFKINDDLLTCFFTNDTTTIQNISQEVYGGGTVLSPDIYSSPRFFWQPVLGVDPSSGGSNRYSIVDFRPGFITDQPLTATKANMALGAATGHNGFTITSGKVETIKVVFFNIGALPPPDESTPTVAYMGFGPKAVRLVD